MRVVNSFLGKAPMSLIPASQDQDLDWPSKPFVECWNKKNCFFLSFSLFLIKIKFNILFIYVKQYSHFIFEILVEWMYSDHISVSFEDEISWQVSMLVFIFWYGFSYHSWMCYLLSTWYGSFSPCFLRGGKEGGYLHQKDRIYTLELLLLSFITFAWIACNLLGKCWVWESLLFLVLYKRT